MARANQFDRRPVVADLVVARRLLTAQLQPVQRALARDRRAPFPARRQLARQHRHHRIVPQLVVVVSASVHAAIVADCAFQFRGSSSSSREAG